MGLLVALYTEGMDAPEKRRWYCPTPGWLVLGSLAVTGLLWLSSWLGWPQWHKGYAVLAAVAGLGVALAVMLLWWLVALAFRWRFQFSLRSLVVMAVAVALPCSWLALGRQEAKREKEAAAAIEEWDGEVRWSETSGPFWLQSLLGDDYCRHVKIVMLPLTKVTDAGLFNLKGLNQLQVLCLNNTQITDAGLENFKGLNQLQTLYLNDTQITDAGLENLKGLNQLRRLSLGNTQITDAGLENLKGLNQLQELLCTTLKSRTLV